MRFLTEILNFKRIIKQFLEVENKDNEQGVKESTKILMNCIENEMLPAYDLFDDLRELDKRVNGGIFKIIAPESVEDGNLFREFIKK